MQPATASLTKMNGFVIDVPKHKGGTSVWVWAKKTHCPGKRGEGGCGCGKPKNATLFGDTKAGQVVAAANKKGGSGNGYGVGESAEVKRRKPDLKKAQDALAKGNTTVVQVDDDDDDDDAMEVDASAGPPTKTKPQLEKLLAEYEKDLRVVTTQLAEDPKSSRYRGWQGSLKTSQEEAKAALRELQDPADQLRGKVNRLDRLRKAEQKLREKLREGSLEEEELEQQLAEKVAANDRVRT